MSPPIRVGSVVELPVTGRVAEVAVSGRSVQFVVPIDGGDDYCVHLGGEIMLDGGGQPGWRGDADSAERSSLGPLLDLHGSIVSRSWIDESQRVFLEFDDGRRVSADPGEWEAHWLDGSGDDVWVPREGPNIP